MALLDIAAILGAGARGQQDYQKFLQEQQQAQQIAKMRDMEMRAYQDKLSQQQQDAANTQGANALMMNFFKDRLAQVPPPPPTAPQAPAPGQASVPMQQPGQQQQQTPQQDPSANLVNGLKQRAQMLQTIDDPNEKKSFVNSVFGNIAALPNPAQRDQLSKVWANVVQQDAQKIPPYRSMSGQQGGAQQNQQPTQIPQMPKMSMEEIAKWAVKQGVTNPNQFAAFLDKAQGFMNNEAKMEASQWKQMYQAELISNAQERLKQGDRRLDQGDTKLGQGQQALDQKAPLIQAQTGLDLAKTEKTRKELSEGQGKDNSGAIDAAAWDRIITGHPPPSRGGVYQSVMNRVAEIAKENGMSTQELMSSSADVKSKLAAKKNFEVRAQNMKRAENQLEAEIPVFEDAVKEVNAPSVPALANLELSARRQMGDPLITKMDQAAEVIFREFEGLVTGNPGTLNVQDVQNAHNAYTSAKTPQQAQAAIAGMRRIIKNAQNSMEKTRTEIMGDINQQLRGNKKPDASKPNDSALPDGWSVKVK